MPFNKTSIMVYERFAAGCFDETPLFTRYFIILLAPVNSSVSMGGMETPNSFFRARIKPTRAIEFHQLITFKLFFNIHLKL